VPSFARSCKKAAQRPARPHLVVWIHLFRLQSCEVLAIENGKSSRALIRRRP
jgi:hypothetical protein